MGLGSLDVGRCLHGCLFEGGLLLGLGLETEVYHGQSAGILAGGREDIAARPESSHCLLSERPHGIVVAGIAGIRDFLAVDVEHGPVIIAEIQIYLTFSHILRKLDLPPDPDVSGLPEGLGIFLVRGAEAAVADLPSGIIVVCGCPVALRLGLGVPAFPASLLRHRHKGEKVGILDAHETIDFPVHLEGSDERECLPGPMLYRGIVEMVGSGPCACVRVNADQRIGRGPQAVADNRRVGPAGRKGSN